MPALNSGVNSHSLSQQNLTCPEARMTTSPSYGLVLLAVSSTGFPGWQLHYPTRPEWCHVFCLLVLFSLCCVIVARWMFCPASVFPPCFGLLCLLGFSPFVWTCKPVSLLINPLKCNPHLCLHLGPNLHLTCNLTILTLHRVIWTFLARKCWTIALKESWSILILVLILILNNDLSFSQNSTMYYMSTVLSYGIFTAHTYLLSDVHLHT